MAIGTGRSALGYQIAWASLASDATVNDGNTATGKDQTAATLGATASVTGGVDLGSILRLTNLNVDVGTNYNGTLLAVETSTNSTTWTALTATAPVGTGTFAVFNVVASGMPVSCRYIRVSISATYPSGSGLFAHVAVREITATVLTLTGQSVTAARGTLVPVGSLALSGQSLVVAQGAVSAVADVTAALTGLSVTAGQGSVSPSSATALTSLSVIVSTGTVSAGADVASALTGQSASAAAGSLVASQSAALTGQSLSASAGILAPSSDAALTGQALSALMQALTNPVQTGGPCGSSCWRDIVIQASPSSANLLDRTEDSALFGGYQDPWFTGHIAATSRATFTWTIPSGLDIASYSWNLEYTVVQGAPVVVGLVGPNTPGTYQTAFAFLPGLSGSVVPGATVSATFQAHAYDQAISPDNTLLQYNHPDYSFPGHPEFGVNYPSQFEDSFFFEVDITCFTLVLRLKCPTTVTEIPSGATETLCADVSEHIAGSYYVLPDWIKAGYGWVIDKVGQPGHWAHGPQVDTAPAVLGVDACQDLIVDMPCSPYSLDIQPLGSVINGPLVAVRLLRIFNDPSNGWTYDIATSRPFNWIVAEVCDGIGPPPIIPPPPDPDERGIDVLYWKEGYHIAEIKAGQNEDGTLKKRGTVQVVSRWREVGPFEDAPVTVNENADCFRPRLSHARYGPPLGLVYVRPGGVFRHESYDYGKTWIADPSEDMAFHSGDENMASTEVWNERTGERLLFYTASGGISVDVFGPHVDETTGRLKKGSTYAVSSADAASFGAIFIPETSAIDCVCQSGGKRKVMQSHDDARSWTQIEPPPTPA